MVNKLAKRRRGRPPKHGGYSLIHRDELLKDHPHIRRYLQDSRDGLIRDVAGSEDQLSEQQRIMIDRIISRLSICRLIEIYIEKYGPFRRDQLNRRKILELEPALGINYLAFSNSIDRALIALGLNGKRGKDVLDLGRYIAEKDKAKAEKVKEGKGSDSGKIDDPGVSAEEVSGPGEKRSDEKGKAERSRRDESQEQASGQGKEEGGNGR